MSDADGDHGRLVLMTADVVSAFVTNNHIQGSELPKLLADVYEAVLSMSGAPAQALDEAGTKASPQEIKKSISHEFLISFEDGKPYKTLRRHLTLRGLTPEAYRAKWGLPADYPMTSVSYSEQRSKLARALGLGQQRRKVAAVPAEVEVSESAPAKARAKRSEADADASPAPKRKSRARAKAAEG